MPEPTSATTVRDADEDDLPAILSIYNDVIANTTAVYSEIPVTLESRFAWLAQLRGQGYPVIIAERGGERLGFGSFAEFRAWPCYAGTVEHSLHVRADARGQGVGRLLVQALLVRARRLDKHVVIAGIDAANEASLRLHRGLGFEDAGRLREVGRKFDRWLDLVLLQKRLGRGG